MNETVIGKPEIMVTPLAMISGNSSDKLFYGEVSMSTFKLTNNSVFSSSGHIITGLYRLDSNLKVEVEYEIKPSTFSYWWIRIILLLTALTFNLIFVLNMPTFRIGFIAGFNVFLILALFLSGRIQKRRGRNLQNIFIEEFEISN